ncbi:MAG: hypothetical protein IPP68_07900 [Elusimicrobia bacterium]|nr:hypothetical protein [Elusimicrobiota bacterium]
MNFRRLFLIGALVGPSFAGRAEDASTQSQGELSLPWAAFEKLLQLNKDNVLLTWEEFQRLLQQTGAAETPPYQLQNGQVSLTRDEFKRLLDRLKPPAGEGAKAYLTRAVYTGRVTRKGATVTAKIRLDVATPAGAYSPVRVPLFPDGVAFEDILLDGRPALVESAGGWTTVTVPRPGEHELTAVFALSSTLDKEPYRVNFQVPATPITQVDFFLDAPHLEARVDGAAQAASTPADGGTRVRASLPQGNSIGISWNAVEPERAKGPAKVYATVHQLLSVQDDAVRATARVELDVLQNTINNLSIVLPEGYTLLDVTGDAVGEWKKRGEGARTLFVPFAYARKGRFTMDVRVERAFKDTGGALPFDGFRVLDVVRESGDLLIEKTTNGEVTVAETAGLTRLDPRETPPALSALASQTFLDAYKYIRPPYRLSLDIRRHEEIAVVSSVIDTANAVTLLLKDGKCVTHVTWSVKNTARQFLELRLPPGAEVWSVVVDGRPAKPSKNAEGATLVPLNRSRIDGDNLAPYDVEVMYFRPLSRPGPGGWRSLDLPNVDLKISQLIWSVYLPTEDDYLYFGGTVDKEKDAEGFRPLAAVARGQRRILNRLSEASTDALYQSASGVGGEHREARKQKARQSAQYNLKSEFDESQGINEDAFAQQVEREINFFSNVNRSPGGGDATGTPLRIKVPNAGQIYRFSKVLVQENEPMTLGALHLHGAVIPLVKLLLVLGILLALFRLRLRLRQGWDGLGRLAERHPRELGWIHTPLGAAAGLFALGIALSWVSKFFAFVAFLGSFALAGRWIFNRWLAGRKSP